MRKILVSIAALIVSTSYVEACDDWYAPEDGSPSPLVLTCYEESTSDFVEINNPTCAPIPATMSSELVFYRAVIGAFAALSDR